MIDLLISEPFLEYMDSYNQCFLSPSNIPSSDFPPHNKF